MGDWRAPRSPLLRLFFLFPCFSHLQPINQGCQPIDVDVGGGSGRLGFAEHCEEKKRALAQGEARSFESKCVQKGACASTRNEWVGRLCPKTRGKRE